MIYSFVKWLARIFYRTWFRLSAEGLEHIPLNGPVIVCCNHISLWDPPSLGILLPRKIRYMAKAELFFPVFGWFIRQLGAFPVKRGGVSKESIRLSIDLLKQGELLGIFPEGTRNRDESRAGKRGAALLALKSGATVIPAAIKGSYKPFSQVKVIYGSPVDLSEFMSNDTVDASEKVTDKIMESIRSLSRSMNGNTK